MIDKKIQHDHKEPVRMREIKTFYMRLGTEKGKPVEKWGRKVSGLRYEKTIVLGWLDCLEYDLYFGGKKVARVQGNTRELDREWIQLIMEAKELGLDKKEIRTFLNQHNEKELITFKSYIKNE